MKYLSLTEISRALEKAAESKTHSERNFAMLQVLAKSGVRVSELIALTPKNVLTEEKRLIIRGKGNKVRNVKVPIVVIMYLNKYIKTAKIRKTNRIFPLTRQAVRDICIKLAGVTTHVFRHSYAIHLLRRTKNIRYVQIQLGHAYLSTTAIYLQYMEFEQEENKIEGMFE